MILKLLLVIAVIAIVYFFFIKKKPIKNTTSSNAEKKKKEKLQSNDMVECSECGVYVELDESIISNNKYYCSDECVEKA